MLDTGSSGLLSNVVTNRPVSLSTTIDPGNRTSIPRSLFCNTNASRNISPDSGSSEFCDRMYTPPFTGSSSNGDIAVTSPTFDASGHFIGSFDFNINSASAQASRPPAADGLIVIPSGNVTTAFFNAGGACP